MPSGGKRKGAGRKKGSTNKAIDGIRDVLNSRQEELLNKAIEMALEGNHLIMNKLLDKMLPTLAATEMKQTEMPPIEIKVVD